MKHNGIEICTGVGTSGHGRVPKNTMALLNAALDECIERRGMRTPFEDEQRAKMKKHWGDWRAKQKAKKQAGSLDGLVVLLGMASASASVFGGISIAFRCEAGWWLLVVGLLISGILLAVIGAEMLRASRGASKTGRDAK